MSALPQEIIEILRNLTTPRLVETVPFDVKAKVAYRLSNVIEPPIGWAVNDEPWTLTEAGLRAWADAKRAALGETQ
jgi:hypothetical protein